MVCTGYTALSWWRHKWKHFPRSPLWGESTGDRCIPLTKGTTRSFGGLFNLHLNKQLSKQWRRRWFETPPRSLRRHCNASSKRHYDRTGRSSVTPAHGYGILCEASMHLSSLRANTNRSKNSSVHLQVKSEKCIKWSSACLRYLHHNHHFWTLGALTVLYLNYKKATCAF